MGAILYSVLIQYMMVEKIMIVSTLKVHFLTFFRWNQLDVAIVFLSVLGIVLEELKSDLMPINPTIMRVMRVLRIARGKETKNRQTTHHYY